MTYQERWAEGPPVGEPPRAELLTPEEVREALALADDYDETKYEVDERWVKRLCRDYLTLWNELEQAKQRVEELGEDFASWVWDRPIK
jgi:hypothetical protein